MNTILIYVKIIVPLFIYPSHNKWVINPGQVVITTTKQTEVKGNNSLERNTNYGKEWAMNSIHCVPD